MNSLIHQKDGNMTRILTISFAILFASCGGPYKALPEEWERSCETNFDCVVVPQTTCSNECRIMSISLSSEKELLDEITQAKSGCPLYDSTCRTQFSRVSVQCLESECRMVDAEGNDIGISLGALSLKD